MKLTETRKGEIYVISSYFLGAFFPIVSILTFSTLTPLYSYGLSILIATVFFAIMVTVKKKWSDFKKYEALKYSLASGLILSIVFYILLFMGFKHTTAGNAGIMLLMEIFFSYVVFRAFMKENIKGGHIIGAFIMVMGAMIILFPGEIKINTGDILILLGTMIAPFGNHFQQKARDLISAEYHLFVRDLTATVIIIPLAYLIEGEISMSQINASLFFIIINGLILLGVAKIFWVEAIHRIPVAKAISFGPIAPAITLTFAYFILGETPTLWQFAGLIPIAFGALLILDIFEKKTAPNN